MTLIKNSDECTFIFPNSDIICHFSHAHSECYNLLDMVHIVLTCTDVQLGTRLQCIQHTMLFKSNCYYILLIFRTEISKNAKEMRIPSPLAFRISTVYILYFMLLLQNHQGTLVTINTFYTFTIVSRALNFKPYLHQHDTLH